MEVDLHPLTKATISGPTLSSLINRTSSSNGDTEGFLFGTFSLLTPSSLSDDSPSLSSQSLIATITSFITATATTTVNHHHHHHNLIGWFSSRRRSSLRPSLREFTLSHSLSLSSNPNPNSTSNFIFLLLTTPFSDSSPSQTLIHTHEYKAFNYLATTKSFEGIQLDIVNIGPAFRGHYSAFCPNSRLPLLPCDFRGGVSPVRVENVKEERENNLNEMKRVAKDQKDLDSYAEGFELGSLSRLMGSEASSYVGGVEELYEKMLAKLGSLAKLVESSSAKVLEQENHNMKLRQRVAGLE